MHKILVAIAIMAFSTTAFAADNKVIDKAVEVAKAKSDGKAGAFVVLVKTDDKGEVSETHVFFDPRKPEHHDAHHETAATLFSMPKVNWSKVGGTLAKGAKMAYQNRDAIVGGAIGAAQLGVAAAGTAQALGAKGIDANALGTAANIINMTAALTGHGE